MNFPHYGGPAIQLFVNVVNFSFSVQFKLTNATVVVSGSLSHRYNWEQNFRDDSFKLSPARELFGRKNSKLNNGTCEAD